MAMYFADEAIVVTNPEVSSVRDSDRVLGLLDAKTSRAELGGAADQDATCCSRATRRRMVKRGEMLSVDDVLELLGIPLLGVIPESKAVLQSSNKGTPAILDETTDVAQAYLDVVYRFLGRGAPAPLHRGGEARLLRPPVRLTRNRRSTMAFFDYFRRAPKDGDARQGSPLDHRGARARRRHARGRRLPAAAAAGAAGGHRALREDRPVERDREPRSTAAAARSWSSTSSSPTAQTLLSTKKTSVAAIASG